MADINVWNVNSDIITAVDSSSCQCPQITTKSQSYAETLTV